MRQLYLHPTGATPARGPCLFGMRTILSLALLLAPAIALADEVSAPTPSPTVSKMADSDCSRARKLGKTCVLTIESEDINGQGVTNDGEKITAISWAKMTSLIEIRRDFIPEIVKSAEDLE